MYQGKAAGAGGRAECRGRFEGRARGGGRGRGLLPAASGPQPAQADDAPQARKNEIVCSAATVPAQQDCNSSSAAEHPIL